MLALAAEYDAAVVLCFGTTANVREIADVPPDADPLPVLLDHFGPRLEHARSLGVSTRPSPSIGPIIGREAALGEWARRAPASEGS